MKKEGYTLTEMSIVLSVIGVIFAITLPSMVAGLQRQATRGAVDRLALAHSLARSTAVRYGRIAELHLDATNARFWVEVDTSGTGVRDTVGLMNDLTEQVTMSSNRSLLCFDSRGLATTRNACEGGDALVQFSVSGRVDTLKITVLGRILR